MFSNEITVANAAGPCRLPIRVSWAAPIAEFFGWTDWLLSI